MEKSRIVALLLLWLLVVHCTGLQHQDAGCSTPQRLQVHSRKWLLSLREKVTLEPGLLDEVPEELLRNGHRRLRKRGRRGGIQHRLRRRQHKPPLPYMLLSNVRSLRNKMDELRINTKVCHEYSIPETALYVSLLCFLSVCSACYISNCPIGGKRSLIDVPARKLYTSMACGPRDRGRCFGPRTCCAAGLGCSVGSPEAASCMKETYISTACENGGRPCGSEGGHCAAPSVCCNSEGCSADLSCLGDHESDPESSDGPGGDLLMKLLHLTKQHLANRTYQ
ncbi:isotocin-neurophysin IT 2-like [Neoarius graeffei]|uniref:isotocin-neurophysin IT 2-like n=1 Tax=Neoarius graeffei TaxID=443677 RepID=UPI00298CCB89|nr:isotocin-neurophysin IT 2-like [Neoarius graeffei]